MLPKAVAHLCNCGYRIPDVQMMQLTYMNISIVHLCYPRQARGETAIERDGYV